jgi:hypothetical protein
MFARILVPLDGSPLAEGVLPEVAELAQRIQADLTLLSVVFDPLDITCSYISRPPLERLREEMIREGGSCGAGCAAGSVSCPGPRHGGGRAARPWWIPAGGAGRGGTRCWSRNG